MAYNGWAIDEYLDADEVNRQLDELKRGPVYGVEPEALDSYVKDYFEAKCRGSKELADEAKKKATKSFDQASTCLMKSPNRLWQSVMIRYLVHRRFPSSPTHLREPHMVYRLVDYSIVYKRTTFIL